MGEQKMGMKGLTPKLLGPIASIVFFLVLVLVITQVKMGEIKGELDTLSNSTYVAMDKANELRYSVLHTSELFTDMSATHDVEVKKEAEEVKGEVADLIKKLKEVAPDSASEWDDISTQYNGLYDTCSKMADAYINNGLDAGNVVMEEVDGVTEKLSEKVDSTTSKMEEKMMSGIKEISNNANVFVIVSLVTSIISLFLAIFIAFVVVRQVLNPIKNITVRIRQLADKNLKIDQYELKQADEMGALASAYTELLKSLKDIMSNLNVSAGRLGELSGEMSGQSDTIVKNMHEITMTVNSVAETAGEQASNIDKSVNEIANLQGIAKKNEEASENLSEASNQISQASKSGNKVVDELYGITKDSEQAFYQIFDSIEKIKVSTSRIGQSSDMIQSIASQTNLLSLNASIEAARAGEMGKGFAVVAEEIRKLSEESASSANEINEMLQELQVNVENANKQSESVKVAVEKQVQGVEDTRSKYDEITRNITIIEKEIQGLAQVSKTMISSCNNVNTAMEHLSTDAQSNVAATEEANASIEEVLSMTEEIANGAAGIDDHYSDLNDIVSQYKL